MLTNYHPYYIYRELCVYDCYLSTAGPRAMSHSSSSGSVQAGTSGVTAPGVRTRSGSNSMSSLAAGAPSLRAALRPQPQGGSTGTPPSSPRDQPNGVVVGSGGRRRESNPAREAANDGGSPAPPVPTRQAPAAPDTPGPPPGDPAPGKCTITRRN